MAEHDDLRGEEETERKGDREKQKQRRKIAFFVLTKRGDQQNKDPFLVDS